jgi:short-chain Z-isoprenyl diphosphate synthase
VASLRDLFKQPLYSAYERRLLRAIPTDRLPAHVAIILDGHRRYARAEGLPDLETSYRAGMAKFEDFLEWCHQLSIPTVTAWVLSTENLKRPPAELDPYFEVLIDLFRRLPERANRLGFSIRFIGSLDLLPGTLVQAAKQAEERAPDGQHRLTVALGYGGRQEIVDACRELVGELVEGGVPLEQLGDRIDTEGLSSHLYTADLPDPDLVIRTSGESRLSGFLLWQSAYAEYLFEDVFWPAFRRVDFLRALRDYARRDRRFGR